MKIVLCHFAWILKQRFSLKSYKWLFFYYFLPSAFATFVLSTDPQTTKLLTQMLWVETVVILMTPLWAALGSTIWYGIQMLYYDDIKRAPGYFGKKVHYHERYQAEAKYLDLYDKDERIIASANLDNRGVAWVVLAPGRHHHCIWYMSDNGANKNINDQGFFTSHGRYIDREVARQLAITNGQCPNPPHSRDLFSEDLWDTPSYLREAGIEAEEALKQEE
jgi:hypothetical protein